jgi:uncharacterized protein YndB with AHSA1/START domain
VTDAAVTCPTETIVVDDVFPHAPEVIWRALTTGDLMARWLMKPTGFAPFVGNRFTYQTTPAGPWDGVIHCQVLEVVPGSRLSYSWKGGDDANTGYGSRLDTIVTFAIEPVESGARLRVSHSGFQLPRNQTAYEKMSGGWKQVVQKVGGVAATLH